MVTSNLPVSSAEPVPVQAWATVSSRRPGTGGSDHEPAPTRRDPKRRDGLCGLRPHEGRF